MSSMDTNGGLQVMYGHVYFLSAITGTCYILMYIFCSCDKFCTSVYIENLIIK